MVFNSIQRIRALSIIFGFLVLLLVWRLFQLQVIYGDDYRDNAERQYAAQTGSVYDRGTIFFTKKTGEQISGAAIASSYYVAISPKDIGDSGVLYEKLSSVLPGIDAEEFKKRASRTDDSYEVLIRGLSEEQGKTVRALKLPFVWVYQENYRTYPGGTLGAHVLGVVARSKDTGDTVRGRYGLERVYEDTLVRIDENLYGNFFADILAGARRSLSETEVPPGNIVTSIEPVVQGVLEKELLKIQEKWGPETVGGIVIEPKTGRMIALAALPTFDPNRPGSASSSAVFSNPLVEHVYEMGSIVKPITVAAALDAGSVTASTTYKDEGFRVFDGKRIENFDGKGRGVVSMQEALNQSLNTGMVFIVEKMGMKPFSEKMKQFGLGERTGIDLPSEARGLIKNLDSSRMIEHATASYGQGIALTPIGVVRALSALANGGLLVEPRIVDAIAYERSATTEPIIPRSPERILKPETSREISRMLTEVVDTALLHGKAKLDRYSVAAKTGTAQISEEKGGGYYEDRYLHSFFGYFPSYDPKFLVFLFSKNPRGAQYASETLAQPFMDLTSFLIHYYEIPPDR